MKKNILQALKQARPSTKLTPYKIFWVFIIACVAGYFIEMLFELVHTGQFASRQGLLYGPFNQVYGIGAVLMALFLHRIPLKHVVWIFIVSALVGGGFEALASLRQQAVFGSVSWDYSAQPLSILGGRTSLRYMVYWGLLGVVFMKILFPLLMRIVDWIPRKPGKILAMLLAVFFVFNVAISAASVYRWSERVAGIPAKNAVAVFLDKHYPDSRMQTVYPNMTFKK